MASSRPFDHLNSFRFQLVIDGRSLAAFASCDGLEISIDVIETADGPVRFLRKRPGLVRHHNIILRRGLTRATELWDWFRAAAEGRVERKAGSIVVLEDDQSEVLRYNFLDGWPCRWKSLVLDASRSDVLIEELELAVETIERAE